MKKLLLVLLVSCNVNYDSPQLLTEIECVNDGSLDIDDSNVCAMSEICSFGALMEYRRYLCICDGFCFCFFAYANVEDGCRNPSSKTCKYKSFMTFANDGFCKVDNKVKLLNEMKTSLNEIRGQP